MSFHYTYAIPIKQAKQIKTQKYKSNNVMISCWFNKFASKISDKIPRYLKFRFS